ncbi:MAG: acyl-CoA synthetase [Pseudomonadales bacterium]|nr:acyl-CoA synthetase [Pseudomonadales bacterium]
MEFNLATIFEYAVDQYPEREYIVCDGKRCTYKEMDERANRLAHHLASQGIGQDDHVGIYAYNSMEWVETLWAVFKLRAVWININFRYVEDELAYIFENADLKALVLQREFAQRTANVITSLPQLQHTVLIEDGSGADAGALDFVEYENVMNENSPARDFPARSGEDKYMLYTGGTTGMPKGVVWQHKDVFMALGGGIDQTTGVEYKTAEEVVKKGAAFQLCLFPLAPLMHGASQWAVMGGSFEGRKLVLRKQFDAGQTWRDIDAEKINGIFITGDAMAIPLMDAYEKIKDDVDVSSMFVFASSAVIFSSSVKDRVMAHFPNVMLLDSIGSSETGGNGILKAEKGKTAMKGGPTVEPGPGTVVLDQETYEILEPGCGKTGFVATTGYIPIGYYKDPEKTAKTFITAPDGKRYAIPGDHAIHEADGTITMLGRGSGCINSGGEKIFSEEVESACKNHVDIYDCVVVGVPDERWGSKVAAIIELRGEHQPDLEAVQEECRKHIARYKVPRELHFVTKVLRAPSGKPDYRWAKAIAAGEIV